MKYLYIFLLVLISLPQFAQQPEENSLQDLYQNALYQSDILLNGREYNYYFYPHISTPLIPADPVPSASIIIQGTSYENIMLLYDTYKEMVVYYDPYNQNNNIICPVAINRDIIDEFTLSLSTGRVRFNYLEFPDNLNGKLNSGFYEMVYDGECQFLIHHTSVLIKEAGRDTYHYKTERYIINAGNLYKIKGKKSLLEALSDRATEVKKYIKRSKIRVRRAEKDQLKSVVNYYDSLKLP